MALLFRVFLPRERDRFVVGFGTRDLVLVCTDCRGFLEVAEALDFQVFRCRRLVVVVDGSDIFDNVVRGNRAD